MSSVGLLLLALALIAGNGFFVGAEFAVLAARRARLEPLAATSRRARTAIRATESLPLMISGCQFGITLCSLGLGALGEPAVARLLTGPFAAFGLPERLVHPAALVVALTVVSALHMLLGEMVPKNLALAGPERAAQALAPPLVGFVRVFRPVIVTLTATATGVLRMLRIPAVSEVGEPTDRDAVAALIAESRHEGLLGADQHELLTGALALERRTAASVTLPMETLVCVPPDVTPAQVETLVARTGYSRFPVLDADPSTTNTRAGHPDAPRTLRGYVHLADALAEGSHDRDAPLPARWIRPMPDVAAAEPLPGVLAVLQRSAAHLARVTDPAGRVIGVVALEDVLETLVGEVRDATARQRP